LFTEEQKKFRTLFRKGAVDIILFLGSVGEARYSEIKSQEYVIGDRSLSRTLKALQNLDLVYREVLPTVPVSTIYSLTDKGKLVVTHLKELRNIL